MVAQPRTPANIADWRPRRFAPPQDTTLWWECRYENAPMVSSRVSIDIITIMDVKDAHTTGLLSPQGTETPENLRATLHELEQLHQVEEAGRRPHARAIDRATDWIRRLFDNVVAGQLRWLPPHVAPGQEGEVELEWWCSTKSLTVYIARDGITALASWGPHMDDEMREEKVESNTEMKAAWDWLTNPHR